MNFGEAQLKGFLLTEAEIQHFDKVILSQYDEAKRLIDARLAKLYADFASTKQDDLYNWLIQFDRNTQLQKDIAAIYRKSSVAAGRAQAQAGQAAMTNNYYRQLFTTTFAAPGLPFASIDTDLVNLAVTGQIELWNDIPRRAQKLYGDAARWMPQAGTLSSLLKDNRATEVKRLQRALNAGLIAGDSYRKVSKNVASVIGSVTKEGATGAMASALRIARTEGTRLMGAGSYSQTLTAMDAGLEIMRAWMATFDVRTRKEHANMDGVKAKADEPFVFPQGWTAYYPGAIHTGNYRLDQAQNIRCRCTTIDIVNDQGPELRRGRNPATGKNEVFSYKNYSQWATDNGLKRNVQGRLVPIT